MATPRVTAVIPTWNMSRALRCAIASALNQTFADFELLVMGDGCTDDSAEVAASFHDPRLIWHNLPVNSGNQSVPNNTALERARGEYLAYLGHDDLWLPKHLENLVRTADQTKADFIAGGVIMLGPPGSGTRVLAGLLPENAGAGGPIIVPPTAFMHRTDVGRAIQGWRKPDESVLPPDMDFLKRCWEYRHRVASTGSVSVLKFNTTWRPNSYVTQDATEQEESLRRMQAEKDYLEQELQETVLAFVRGNLTFTGQLGEPPPGIAKGWFASETRRIRAVSGVAVGTEALPHGVRFTADHPGLSKGFQPPENTPELGPFRWTGPGTVSVGVFSGVPAAARQVRLQLLGALMPEQLDLQLSLNGITAPLIKEASAPGVIFKGVLPVELRGQPALHMEITIPKVLRPCNLNSASPDQRWLGVMFAWIEFLNDQPASVANS